MSPAASIELAIAIPLVGAVVIALCDRRPNLREAVTLVTAALLLVNVVTLVPAVFAGGRPDTLLLQTLPGLSIYLRVEPLGMSFAVIASSLWIVNSIYSIGYMRGNAEPHQTRFYMCFAVALASTMGVAFAGNMFTLFIFYEVLTLCTYPLVTHKGTPEAMKAGRTYLGILLGTSIGLQLLAILWTWTVAGTLDFTPGGILDGKIDGVLVAILLALYMFGIGKAALMPFHRWLPAAMVAPTPVSALLHAVAVVKAGVFTVMKVAVYIFGIDFLATTGASGWLIWVAAATLLFASVIALSKDNLKARLAYSTVSQLAYVVLGAALATSMGVIGGSLQIAMHAVGKITLFFCAGAIYTATHKTEVSELDGLGRTMPFTFAAFLVGSLSIIGLPPLGGSWSKWYLMLGAADAGETVVLGVLMLSSLLSLAYLLPIVTRGFFLPAPRAVGAAVVDGDELGTDTPVRIREAPILCVVPLCVTAVGCIVLFFYADAVYRLLAPIASTSP